jgi:two-component system, sensor histidine kinase PdtaS
VHVFADTQDILLDVDLAIPCGLIINELVSNSLKYAFRDGREGEIRVGLARDGRNYILTVSDNGPGLPPDVDFLNTPSLGLQLVNMLAGQLEGTVELDCTRGTRFKITFAEIE